MMIDINLIRNNSDLVKENIKKKFQNNKLEIVDEIINLDKELRDTKTKADNLRSNRNTISSEIGICMRNKDIETANMKKAEVVKINELLVSLEQQEEKSNILLKEKMMLIPNIIDDSVPIGKDDSENVEIA